MFILISIKGQIVPILNRVHTGASYSGLTTVKEFSEWGDDSRVLVDQVHVYEFEYSGPKNSLGRKVALLPGEIPKIHHFSIRSSRKFRLQQ